MYKVIIKIAPTYPIYYTRVIKANDYILAYDILEHEARRCRDLQIDGKIEDYQLEVETSLT